MSEFNVFTLSNGLTVLFQQSGSPVAYSALTINCGTRDESSSSFGLAHFTEHMLFKGTASRKAYAISSLLEKTGGELNAFTTKEDIVIHSTVLNKELKKSLDIMSDVVFESIVPEHELEKEKRVILDEIDSYYDIPSEMIYDQFEDILFEGNQLGHNILGTHKSVSQITRVTVLDFIKEFFSPANMILSVSADIDMYKFLKMAEFYFGSRRVKSLSIKRKKAAYKNRNFREEVNRNTTQAHCILGNLAFDHKNEKRTAMALLMNILAGPSANSLLNNLLREKNGLTYNIDGAYTSYSDTGIASIYFGTEKNLVDKCIRLITKQIDKLSNETMKESRVMTAKKQFISQLAISMENRESYMLGAAKSYMIYKEIDNIHSIQEKIDRVSAEDLRAVCREVFSAPSVLIYR